MGGRPVQPPAQVVVVGVVAQGDESLEAAGVILQFPQPQQVIDPVLVLLDVPIEHGGVGVQPQVMSSAMDGKPGVGIGLLGADLPADVRVEDLGPAAGHRIQPGRHQPAQHRFVVETGQLGEEIDLDGSEGLEMHPGIGLLEGAQDVFVVVEAEPCVQTADDVEFGDARVHIRPDMLDDLGRRPGVGAGAVLARARKRAEVAVESADVGGVDVAVLVEVDVLAAVAPLVHQVGHLTDGQQVVATKEAHAVIETEALPGLDFGHEIGQRSGGRSRGGRSKGRDGWSREGGCG